MMADRSSKLIVTYEKYGAQVETREFDQIGEHTYDTIVRLLEISSDTKRKELGNSTNFQLRRMKRIENEKKMNEIIPCKFSILFTITFVITNVTFFGIFIGLYQNPLISKDNVQSEINLDFDTTYPLPPLGWKETIPDAVWVGTMDESQDKYTWEKIDYATFINSLQHDEQMEQCNLNAEKSKIYAHYDGQYDHIDWRE